MGAAAAAVQVDDNIKRSIYIRELLNGDRRNFAYSKMAEKTYSKAFSAMKHDIRLMNFARNIVGAVSDCYILYAIAMMGVCDIESIMLFLRVLSNKNKELLIGDMRDYEGVYSRVELMVKNGMLFKHSFEFKREREGVKRPTVRINLYSIEKSAQHLITQKLGTKLAVNEWIDAKPLNELMGWAACGYVKGRVAECGRFLEYKQGVVRTKAIGTAIYPGEVKLQSKDGKPVSVAFVQAFMRHNKAFHTVEQYQDMCIHTINTIKQYFYMKDQKNDNCCVVVVVEDNPDLMTAGEIIHNAGILKEDYDRIYFTGEGVIRGVPDSEVKDCFLQLRDDGGENFMYVAADPVFV